MTFALLFLAELADIKKLITHSIRPGEARSPTVDNVYDGRSVMMMTLSKDDLKGAGRLISLSYW